MAYDLQEQRIIPAGLHFIAPHDKTPTGGCLQLQGFEPGSLGSLKMRSGSSTLLNGSGTSSPHTCEAMQTLAGWLRFVGDGAGIYNGTSGALIDTGYDGTPLGIIASSGWAWFMNRGRQKKYNGTVVRDWTPPVPGGGAATLTPSGPDGGTFVPGTYNFYLSTTTDSGHESNTVGPFEVEVTAATDTVLCDRPTTTDPDATGWHIYRKDPDSAQLYRINDSVIPWATAQWNDWGIPLVDLQDRDIVHGQDHDPAPAARVALREEYNGRLVVASTAAYPNRVFWTLALEPYCFPLNNWLDVGERQEPVMALVHRPGMLIIYKANSIWRHIGDLGSGTLELVVSSLGLAGVKAIASSTAGDFFRARDGVYFFNGDATPDCVSRPLQPLFDAQAQAVNGSVTEAAVDDTSRTTEWMAERKGRVYWGHLVSGAYRVFVFDTQTGQWHKDGRSVTAARNEGDSGDFFAARANRNILIGSGWADDTGQIPLAYQSRYEDQGLPEIEKTYAELVIKHNLAGVTLTVKAHVNDGATSYTLGTITSSSWTETVLKVVDGSSLPVMARNLAVEISGSPGSAPSAPPTISHIFLRYYVEAPQHLTFDTDEMDLGDARVKVVDWVEFDLDSTAICTATLNKALPGDAMTQGWTTTIAATSSRKPVRVPVSPAVEGKLLRLTLASTGSFRLYGCRIHVRGIGVYVVGATSDVWTIPEQTVGV